MKTLLHILTFFMLCNLSAQKNCSTCWGQNDTVPTFTKQDKQALRLYSKLNWYDFSTYQFKGEGKRIVWISYFAAGVLHGGREAYHAEATVFEKRFNARPQSFFGSEQWKRNYFDRDPDSGHKPNIWNSARDYYHFSHLASSTIWVGGAFTIGMSKQPMKYKLLDLLISALITSGSASLTYNLLR